MIRASLGHNLALIDRVRPKQSRQMDRFLRGGNGIYKEGSVNGGAV